jgi:hypothetical protein
MGLDTSYDCFTGAYSSFNRFRARICETAGLGNIYDYLGYGGNKPYPVNQEEPLMILIDHSDCDGEISAEDCKPLQNALIELRKKTDPDNPDDEEFRHRLTQFIDGLEDAIKHKDSVEFY